MGASEWYTVYFDGGVYTVQKIDPDDRTPVTNTGERQKTAYRITTYRNRMYECNCIAHARYCRHKAIVVFFKDTKRVNQRWLYNFDTQEWLPPFTQEG